MGNPSQYSRDCLYLHVCSVYLRRSAVQVLYKAPTRIVSWFIFHTRQVSTINLRETKFFGAKTYQQPGVILKLYFSNTVIVLVASVQSKTLANSFIEILFNYWVNVI